MKQLQECADIRYLENRLKKQKNQAQDQAQAQAQQAIIKPGSFNKQNQVNSISHPKKPKT